MPRKSINNFVNVKYNFNQQLNLTGKNEFYCEIYSNLLPVVNLKR